MAKESDDNAEPFEVVGHLLADICRSRQLFDLFRQFLKFVDHNSPKSSSHDFQVLRRKAIRAENINIRKIG